MAEINNENLNEVSGGATSGFYWVSYTVQAGDCLSVLGERFGYDYRVIASDNNIKDVNKIYVGQVLKMRKYY